MVANGGAILQEFWTESLRRGGLWGGETDVVAAAFPPKAVPISFRNDIGEYKIGELIKAAFPPASGRSGFAVCLADDHAV